MIDGAQIPSQIAMQAAAAVSSPHPFITVFVNLKPKEMKICLLKKAKKKKTKN